MDTELTDMSLDLLWARLAPELSAHQIHSVATTIISKHKAMQVLTFIEHQKPVHDESVMLTLQCLLCSNEVHMKNALSQWLCCEETIIDSSKLMSLVQRIIDYSTVPKFPGREDIGFNVDDFAGVAVKAETGLRILQSLMDVFGSAATRYDNEKQTDVHQIIDAIIDKMFILILEHMDESSLWTSRNATATATHLLKDILEHRKKTSVSALLCEENGTQPALFTVIAQRLHPALTKCNWKRSPSACSAFYYCLSEINFPSTSVFLEQLLPPSLLFSDDHELGNKIMGVKCLHHIIRNTSAGELSWFNRIDVIHASLDRLLYTREPELLAVLLPCVLDLLKAYQKLAKASTTADSVRPMSKADEIFLRLLTDMQLENNLSPRRLYSCHLVAFVQLLDIGVLRHVKKLLMVMASFLEISDGKREQSRLNMLEVLKVTIKTTWPRIGSKCEVILRMLIPMVYELAAGRGVWADGVKSNLLGKCEEIILLLHKVDPERMRALLGQLLSVETLPDCDNVIRKWYEICAVV